MNLFNYFKFVATGYIRKKKVLYGTTVLFTFKHDTEIFDPFKMILDQYYKISQLPKSSHISISTDFDQVQKVRLLAEGKKPKVSVKIQLKAGLLEMHRFVLREDKRTTSLYMVYLNQEPFILLNKKYDYGSDLQEHLNQYLPSDMQGQYTMESPEEYASFLFSNPRGEACFIEKFVHTHIFCISKFAEYQKVCEEMSSYVKEKMA